MSDVFFEKHHSLRDSCNISRLFCHNGLKGHEDDFKVFDERVAGNVLEVDAELVLHHYVAVVLLWIGSLLQKLVLVAVADGGHVGDAGADIQDVHLFRGVEVNVFPDLRSGTHQAHVPDENVDELRQLVQLVLTDPVAGTGHPRVMSADGDKPLLVRAHPHRAELEQAEILVATTYPYLPVEHRAGRVELDPYRQY